MKRATKLLLIVLLTVSSLFGLCSCQRAEKAESYKIGIMASQTGNYAGLGTQSLDGLKLIADETNKNGGVNGVPLELVIYDDKSEVSEIPTAARQLVEDDKVIVLIEGTVTQMANSLIPVANELQVPAAGISGTALFDDELGAWFFRPMGSESDVAFPILQYLSSQLGISKYAALIENSGYGQGGKVFLPQASSEYNLTIAHEEYFDPGTSDLTPQLSKIKNSDAEAIVIWGSSPTASLAIKQIREMGISLPILTTPAQAAPNMVKEFRQYYEMAPSVVSVDAKIDVWQQLPDTDPDKVMLGEHAGLWQDKYGHPPSMWNVLGAQIMLLVVDGLERAKPDSSNIKEARSDLRVALENTKDLDLPSGTSTMSPSDHYGSTRQKLVLVTYEDGRMVYLP